MKKVTCINCIGTGTEHIEIYGDRFAKSCETCLGTGFIEDINRLKLPIEDYERDYTNRYNDYPGKNKKPYKLTDC